MTYRIIAAAIAASALAACATAPPKACTAEWIDYQINDAYEDLRRDTRKDLQSVKEFGDDLYDGENISPSTMFRLLGVGKSLKKVAETFFETTMPRVQEISQTCDRPDLAADAFGDFLKAEGVPDPLVGMIKDMGVIIEGLNRNRDEH